MPRNIANFALVALTLLLGLLVAGAVAARHGTKSVQYSEFKQLVSTDKVKEVTFSGSSIVGTLKEPVEGATQVAALTIPEDDSLVKILQEKQIAYGAVSEAGCNDGVMFGMAALFALSLWMFIGRQGQGGNGPGVATFGRSSARLAPVEGTGVTFKDAGEGGPGRDRAVPEDPRALHAPRRQDPEGRAADRAARHRQDAARARGRG